VPQRAALYLAVVQFFFATTWTVYVVFLPTLAETVGIPRELTRWILVADQLTFTVTDFAMGWAADRTLRLIGRLAPAIVAVTAISTLAFLAIPHLAGLGSVGTGFFIGALVIWAVTSSALRAPPWVVIGRYAANPSLPRLAALVNVGVAVGGASASYLGATLRNFDPRLPFAVSSLTLFATTAGLIWVERSLRRPSAIEAAPASPPEPIVQGARSTSATAGFLLGAGLLALGFQIHLSFNSYDQYLRFATPAALDYLLPIFWVGFNLLSFPAAGITNRWGGPGVMAAAAVLAALAATIAAAAPNLVATIAGQTLAGGAWGSVLTAGMATSLYLGRTGREGRTAGLWFSIQSAATCLRLAVSALGLDSLPEFPVLTAWAPTVLWLASAAILASIAWRAGTRTPALVPQA
jgi:predicted MFS family arabinose efflux permease